ncbi:MAG: tryptophan--tRNA ligase [Actinomycetes bacterium]
MSSKPATDAAVIGWGRQSARDRVFSAIQPTADSFQIGNYLGAIRHWVRLQDTHDALYCVADQHAITVEYDPQLLRKRTLLSYAQLVAAGIDPASSIVFVQSHVAAHSQLAWMLGCLTGYGEAARMTQFKDKSAREGLGSATVGLFTYPVLMAADILLYQAAGVPVGEDQRQHLELARTLAARFNTRFGDTFIVPKPIIIKDTAKIVDLQDPASKMSKSSPAGCLFLMDAPKQISKKIKSAVTDSETQVRFDPVNKPGVSNLLSILAALSDQSVDELELRYEGSMYGPFKADVADAVVEFAVAYQQRTNALIDDPAALEQLMADGASRAAQVAAPTLTTASDRVGFAPV